MLDRAVVAGPGNTANRVAGSGTLLASGKRIATLTTVGAGTITGAMIAAGVLRRTGPVGGFTDTFDTADNILLALAGNDYRANALQGVTFRFVYINGVAQAMTAAAGVGITLGTVVDTAASLVREYLLTINNSTPVSTQVCNTTNASGVVTLQTPVAAGTITPGQVVSGTGITAGSKVAGVTMGNATTKLDLDKITSITLDQVGASAQTGVSITFSPSITVDGLFAAAA